MVHYINNEYNRQIAKLKKSNWYCHNIEYKSEYIFEDLPNRRYDFAIFKDNQIVRLIEFDGE